MDRPVASLAYSQANAAGSSNAPRRLSYASVASGVDPSTQPGRPGTLGHMATTTPHSSYPPHSSSEGRHSRQTSAYESNASMHGARDSSRTATIQEYSRKYANIGYSGSNTFFIPSYLKDSRYAARLESLHVAKSKAQRGRTSSSTPLLGASSGSTNIQRLTPSHRGMTYEVVESNPPKDEEEITPLPARWNNQDKYPGLDITNDGLDVRYNGSAGKADLEAASVRADYPMSPACGIYYFEIEIKQKSKDCAVAVGFSTQKASLERLPGWEAESWAYHGDDGKAFSGEHQGRNYSGEFSVGDVVGCGLNFVTGQAFFTRNGRDLGIAFRELKNVRPFPSIGIKKTSGAVIGVNFGQRPFIFDIDERMETERRTVLQDIKRTKTSSLHPGLDGSSLIQELVAQFLSHGGYVETAKAFSDQRNKERLALKEEPLLATDEADLENTQAVRRQQIRRAILNGDIDEALQTTNTHFPNVLQNRPQIVFRLKCRKWVELISKAAELRSSHTSTVNSSPHRSNIGSVADGASKHASTPVFDQQMEIDDEHQGVQSFGTKEALQAADNSIAYNQLLTEAMNYGQILQREYRDESNVEYKQTLANIFSLMAYNEPRESVHGHLLDRNGRVKVAEDLNSAILESLGRSPTAALEKTYRQTEALVDILSQDGGAASFVNLKREFEA